MLDNSRKQTRASRFSSKFREYLNDEDNSDERFWSKLGKYASKLEENRVKHKKAYMRIYYLKNRERLLQHVKEYQAKNGISPKKKVIQELTPEMEEALQAKRKKIRQDCYQKNREKRLAEAKATYEKKRSELSLKARERYTGGDND